MGVLGGAVDENRGPHLTSALLIPPSERLRCTDFDRPPLGPPSHLAPSAASSPSAPACWARFEKFPRWSRSKQSRGRRVTLRLINPHHIQPTATQEQISKASPALRSYPASAGLRHHAASSSLRVAGRFHLRRVDHWHHEPFASVVSPEL